MKNLTTEDLHDIKLFLITLKKTNDNWLKHNTKESETRDRVIRDNQRLHELIHDLNN